MRLSIWDRLSCSFNSRTPGGVRLWCSLLTNCYTKFQFTHPGRGATGNKYNTPYEQRVSIHAPREGCDSDHRDHIDSKLKFQFTHPGRGATIGGLLNYFGAKVSIHAPREGCDYGYCYRYFTERGFNSRTPGGVRRLIGRTDVMRPQFQFTHPGRGATRLTFRGISIVAVSIHAPREGCDCQVVGMVIAPIVFQFTHPGRGATLPPSGL